MDYQGKALLLKIFTGENDRVDGKLLFERIVENARTDGLAGATVSRGIMSYGASHSIHTMKIFALSGELPMIVEIVDTEENIRRFLPKVNELMDRSKKGGLVITEQVEVHRYLGGEKYRKAH